MRRTGERGQSLVEFGILVPGFMLILFGLLEFGFLFSHHLTLEYATREGARVGAALGNGSPSAPCSGTSPEPVDWQIVAAVQRVLTSPGSQVPPGRVQEIRIYRAKNDGDQLGNKANVWVPGLGPTVDGTRLLFRESGPTGWDACGRRRVTTRSADADSLGISIVYDYRFVSPLGSMLRFVGPAQLTISDRTVMALNP